jgi:hypothetical protein
MAFAGLPQSTATEAGAALVTVGAPEAEVDTGWLGVELHAPTTSAMAMTAIGLIGADYRLRRDQRV